MTQPAANRLQFTVVPPQSRAVYERALRALEKREPSCGEKNCPYCKAGAKEAVAELRELSSEFIELVEERAGPNHRWQAVDVVIKLHRVSTFTGFFPRLWHAILVVCGVAFAVMPPKHWSNLAD